MDVFFYLFCNLLPLYVLIALGFVAGRWFSVDRQTLANLVIFIVVPVVIFGYIVQLELNPAYALLPVVYFLLSAAMAFLFLAIGRRIYPDSRANLLALATAQNNAGYFGLPVMLMLFETKWIAVYMLIILGGLVYEALIGYYIAARGAFDMQGSLKKLAQNPTIYAVMLALAINAAGYGLPDIAVTYWGYFKGAYVVMGMMIIGVALAKLTHFQFSWRFNGLAFLGKFIVWPLLAGAFVLLDIYVLKFYGREVHTMLMLLSIMPPGANVTAFAAQFNTNPEKAATTVLAGTLFALLYMPTVLWLIQAP